MYYIVEVQKRESGTRVRRSFKIEGPIKPENVIAKAIAMHGKNGLDWDEATVVSVEVCRNHRTT